MSHHHGDDTSSRGPGDDDPKRPRHRRSQNAPSNALSAPERPPARQDVPPSTSAADSTALGAAPVGPSAAPAPVAAQRPPHAALAAGSASGWAPSMAAAATTQAQAAATAQARATAELTAGATAQLAAAAVAPPPPIKTAATRAPVAAVTDEQPPEVAPPVAEPPVGTPSRPYLPRRPHTLFGIHVGQMITWQVAFLAVLLVLQQPPSTLTTAGIASLVLVFILTAIRLHGRWLFQWCALWIRYVARRRRQPILATDKGALDPLLRMITRGGEIESIDIDGTSAALIRHAGGSTVLLAPTPIDARMVSDYTEVILPLTELLPVDDEGELVVSAQLVVHSIPAPSMLLAGTAATLSYRMLSDGKVPAQRRCWVAIQAIRTADDHSDDALHAALISAVRRLQRKLRKAGMRGRTLNCEEATADLLTLAGLDSVPARTDRPLPVIEERWRSCSIGSDVQTTYRLLSWPDFSRARPRSFLNWMAAVPTMATTIAVAVRRNGDEFELEAAVRMTLPDGRAIKRATHELEDIAQKAGARMRRLDGEQVFGLAASLPLGGFLS